MSSLPPPALGPKQAVDDVPQHRRGRWHGLVYVAVPRSRRLVAIAARATSRPPRDLCRDAHVSASRPFGLYAHEIDPFVKKLKSALAARCCRPFCIAIDGTLLKLQSEDGARTFDALAVRPSSALAAVVDAADEALGAFGREPYFAERRFHLSVAEGDDDDDDRSRSHDGSDASSDSDSDASGDVVDVDVDSVIVKAGHRRFEIPLECV